MTIEQRGTIDAIGVDKKTDRPVLSIIDTLDWTEVEPHLKALQDKLNDYLGFIESGQLYEHEQAKGREVDIAVYSSYPTSADVAVSTFLSNVTETLSSMNIRFRILLTSEVLSPTP